MAPKEKSCPPGKILNPVTGRCVKVDGKIGKALLAAANKEKEKQKVKSPVKSSELQPVPKVVKPAESPKSKKEKLLAELQLRCNNDADPISMENFEDMSLDDLENLVYIGFGDKKNCYLLDNIYEVYKTSILSKKIPKDPMDPSHELTDKEINEINAKMTAKNPKHVAPKYELPKPYPKGYELAIDLSPIYGNYFTIKVMKGYVVKHDLGLLPAWVETNHTGSADYTSGVLISNIRELWDKRLLMDNIETCCNVALRRNFAYWQGKQWKQRFIETCEEVKAKLDG